MSQSDKDILQRSLDALDVALAETTEEELTNSRLRVSICTGTLFIDAAVPTDIWDPPNNAVKVSLFYNGWGEGKDFSVTVNDNDDWCIHYTFEDYGTAQRIFLWLVSQDIITWTTLNAIKEHHDKDA